jgi:hypothetical protein
MKPYNSELDAQTKEALEAVYAGILAYIGGKRKVEEPINPADFKKWDKICVLPSGKLLWLEFEVRDTDSDMRAWSGVDKSSFAYITLHVPERKKNSLAYLYVASNNIGTAFAVTTLDKITSSPVVVIDAVNETDMTVFDVKDKEWDFYRMENGFPILDERTEAERYLQAATIPK